MVTYPLVEKPEFIIVMGDQMVHGNFVEHLRGAMKDHLGYVPPIFSEECSSVAAEGAAELRRRASYREKYPWEDW